MNKHLLALEKKVMTKLAEVSKAALEQVAKLRESAASLEASGNSLQEEVGRHGKAVDALVARIDELESNKAYVVKLEGRVSTLEERLKALESK